eukprot:16004328-Heterocapsa_arctica.AAC.1
MSGLAALGRVVFHVLSTILLPVHSSQPSYLGVQCIMSYAIRSHFGLSGLSALPPGAPRRAPRAPDKRSHLAHLSDDSLLSTEVGAKHFPPK